MQKLLPAVLVVLIGGNAYAESADGLRNLSKYCAISGYFNGVKLHHLSSMAIAVAQVYGQANDSICTDAMSRGFKAGDHLSTTGKSASDSDTALLKDSIEFQTRIDRAILELAGFPHI